MTSFSELLKEIRYNGDERRRAYITLDIVMAQAVEPEIVNDAWQLSMMEHYDLEARTGEFCTETCKTRSTPMPAGYFS